MQWLAFTKMHGLGNDFVVVDRTGDDVALDESKAPAMAPLMCDRRRGIGADGVLLIERVHADHADVRMIVLNADGSVPEMCGNGIRCVCKFVVERGMVERPPVRIETGRGVLALDYQRDQHGRVHQVTVDMGAPAMGVGAVGADERKLRRVDEATITLDVAGVNYEATLVSMGNPHAVVFVDDVNAVKLRQIGPVIERHAAFPGRINAHFVQVNGPEAVAMRTWERGSGATQACGTGACAVCVAGALTGRTKDAVTAHLPGGDLMLRWDRDAQTVLMTGPAVEVYEGQWPMRSQSVRDALRLKSNA